MEVRKMRGKQRAMHPQSRIWGCMHVMPGQQAGMYLGAEMEEDGHPRGRLGVGVTTASKVSLGGLEVVQGANSSRCRASLRHTA